MKIFKGIIKALAVPVLLLSTAMAQADNAKELVEAQNFVFKVQSMSPATGSVRLLTPGYYTLTVNKDVVVSDLPYFGRAYSAPVDPTQGALSFKSKNFGYEVKGSKKKWEITITPNDAVDGNKLYLTVYDNGTAYLSVSSTSRQSISFNGVIEAK